MQTLFLGLFCLTPGYFPAQFRSLSMDCLSTHYSMTDQGFLKLQKDQVSVLCHQVYIIALVHCFSIFLGAQDIAA